MANRSVKNVKSTSGASWNHQKEEVENVGGKRRVTQVTVHTGVSWYRMGNMSRQDCQDIEDYLLEPGQRAVMVHHKKRRQVQMPTPLGVLGEVISS